MSQNNNGINPQQQQHQQHQQQQQQFLKVNYQPASGVTDSTQITMPSQTELNSSVQHILATLDPLVVSAAGLNHQHLLAQLQKQQHQQQQQQQDLVAAGAGAMQFTVDTQNASGGFITTTNADALTNLQVGQIPQILLQPPDPDDINGVPTISIPESVVLGAGQGQAASVGVVNPANINVNAAAVQQQLQQQQQQQHAAVVTMETEQQQIERIQNGLIASVKQQQEARLAGMPLSDLEGLSYVEESRVPNFLNIQANRVIGNTIANQPTTILQQVRENI